MNSDAQARKSARTISITDYAEVTSKAPVRHGDDEDDTLSWVGDKIRALGVRKEVSAVDLRNNLKNFLDALHDSFDGIPVKLAGYHLEEMEIEVEVSAEGEVSLLGTGGKVGGKGSLTLKLKRDEPTAVA